MSKTLVLFLGIYGAAMAAALFFPPAGVWGFLFESNHHPPLWWWGRPLSAIGNRWNFYIGAVMVGAVLLNWDRYRHVQVFRHWQSTLIFLFALNAFVVTSWALVPESSSARAFDHAKMALMYLCIVKTHSDRRWLPVIMGIYILSCVKYGWDISFSSAGRSDVGVGPATSFEGNAACMHAAAMVPLALVYGLSSTTKRWFRIACLLGLPLILNIVAVGNSRGAFVGLVAAAPVLLLLARGTLRKRIVISLLLAAPLAGYVFNDTFWERMQTMQTYEEDSSATSRLRVWEEARHAASRYPFGSGAEAFEEEFSSTGLTTMSVYFEVLVAWGVQGVLLFFGFILLTLWDCWKLQKSLWSRYGWPPSQEYILTIGVIGALVCLLVSCIFSNRMSYELWWVLAAVVVCMKNIQNRNPEFENDDEQRDDQNNSSGPQGFADLHQYASPHASPQ